MKFSHFDTLFKNIVEQNNSINDDLLDKAFYFIEDDTNAEIINKFKATLTKEFDKVKAADVRLNNVKLNFDDAYDIDDMDAAIHAAFIPKLSTISINMMPFIINVLSGSTFEDAISNYISFDGEHTIQHECAHALDYFENGDRGNNSEYDTMHDELFYSYEKHLNDITQLN